MHDRPENFSTKVIIGCQYLRDLLSYLVGGRASPSISNVHADAACHSNAKPVKVTARTAENT